MYSSNEGYQDVNFSPPWELKTSETSKGKKKRWRNNRSRVEEGQFKVMYYNILACGVFTLHGFFKERHPRCVC